MNVDRTYRGNYPFSDVEWVRGLHDESRLVALDALKSWQRAKRKVALIHEPCERYKAIKDLEVLAKYVRARICAYKDMREIYHGIRSNYVEGLAA